LGYGSGVVASDGAVWVLTTVGLVRVAGDDWTIMSERATSWQQPAAGPDGSVWAIEGEGGTVVRFDADGSRTPLDYYPGFSPERLAVGPDGALWAGGGLDLARWDGSWQKVPSPPWLVKQDPAGWGYGNEVNGLVVTADGALWVSGRGSGLLGRYADGEWTNFETGDSALWAENLVALSDRTVCIAPYLTCFDATGTIAETLPGVWFDDIDIAPDGAVWVHGEQIARLPDGALQ
jgi:sugar lactone lactonase YvrE